MNLFRLDNDPIIAARYNQDLHVRKIVLEATQLLTNCFSREQLMEAPKTQKGQIRGYTHIHHPISEWTRWNKANFNWALEHAKALNAEFTFRFGKIHFCDRFIEWASHHNPKLICSGQVGQWLQTEQPQCFKAYPECIVNGDPVAGYRNYYIAAKKTFDIRGKIVHATWTKRDIPEWFK